MRRLLATIALAFALAGCSGGTDAVDPNAAGRNGYVAGDGTTSEYPVGDRRAAPAITGDLLDGGTFDLASLRGQVVVLNFWASWCSPCRLEAETLRDVHRSTKDAGVAFRGVNIRDQRDPARKFEEKFGIDYPSLYDPAGQVTQALREFSPNAIPSTVLVDRAGRVAVVIRRAVATTAELEPVVRRVAAEPS